MYCSEFNNNQAPNFVTIFLGCNDVFHHDDRDIESAIDTMFKHYDTLLNMIRNYSKNTVIGVILPIPPAASQDAFGANYKCEQTRWQYKRNQHRLLERMLERYGNGKDKNIIFVPAFFNIDPVNGFPKDSATGRMNNGVHPAQSGYYQIGDSIYCWLNAQLALKPSQKN